MRIGSLFAGIGGLELGLEWAGVGHTVWQVERDPYCREVLARHWPDAARYDDVRTVGSHNLEPVDVICGGFPCQDISYAGKGAGLAGERSGLWFEFARIVGEMGPRYVVVENVAALLTRGLDAVLGTLADLGYDAEWSTLRASDVGAPHRRERVFLVAYRASHGWRGERIAGDMADSSGEEGGAGDQSALSADDCGGRVHQLGDGMGHPARGGRRTGTGLDVRRAERGCDGVGDAERERGCGGRVAQHAGNAGAPDEMVRRWRDAVPVRGADGTVRLIPAEAAAQGPQSPLWPVADGVPGRVARLRAIGNAVVPACAYVVGRRLLAIDAALRQESAA